MTQSFDADANPFAPPVADLRDAVTDVDGQVLATAGQRFLAALVDGAPGLILGGIVFAMFWSHRGDDAAATSGGFIAAFAVFGLVMLGWTVTSLVLVWNYGQTIGKRVMGIRVVRMDGSRISFPRIFFLRGFVAALPSAIPWLGNLYQLLDYLFIFGSARRCIHDYIADSKVVTAASSPHATLAGSRA